MDFSQPVTFWQLVTHLGIPLACMIVMALALWRACIWLGVHIIKPVVMRHLSFLDRIENKLVLLSHMWEEAGSTMRDILHEQTRHHRKPRRQTRRRPPATARPLQPTRAPKRRPRQRREP